MRSYETIVIFEPTLGEAQVIEEIKKIESFLNSKSAVEVKADNWGNKDISYSFGKSKIGFYVQFKFSASDYNVSTELTKSLRLNERILKFQTHLNSDKKRKFRGSPMKIIPTELVDATFGVDIDY